MSDPRYIGDVGPEAPRSRPHDNECDPNDATISQPKAARAFTQEHPLLASLSAKNAEQVGSLFRVNVNGQMFRETTIGKDYAIGVAEGLICGWKDMGIDWIPPVSVEDSTGVEVWTSKEEK